MAKPKRMSELFASSTDKEDLTMVTATPPYSSDGPTLPMIGSSKDQTSTTGIIDVGNATDLEKRKDESQKRGSILEKEMPTPMPPSNHLALYEPWTLLPPDLLELLQSQARLRATQNIIPVVFSKNQNVKSGINRLKAYLGASEDAGPSTKTPDVFKQEDYVIAISAQGEGTTKLVGIVDMVRRIVAPNGKAQISDNRVDAWWMYTVLTSIETERRTPPRTQKMNIDLAGTGTAEEEEEDGFESMNIDGQKDRQGKEKGLASSQRRKVPVLTVWMTRQQIPAFKHAYGEHAFVVEKKSHEDD